MTPAAAPPSGGIDAGPVLAWTLAVVLLAVAALVTALVVRRVVARMVQPRRERRLVPLREELLRLMVEETPDPAAVRRLAALPERSWRLAEPTVVAMLAKVRGGSHDALVEVLEQRGTIDRATRALRSWFALRRCHAAEILGAACRSDCVPLLAPLLDDRNAEVRQVAARALGAIGDPAATAPLLHAARQGHRLPPRDAASALVRLGQDAGVQITGFTAEARDPRVRALGAEVLGLRGAVDSTGLLVSLLGQDPSVQVRTAAARALGRIGTASAETPLLAALESESGELRAVAARALGQLGSPRAVVRLVGCIADASHRVAANAAEALTSLGPEGLTALETVAVGHSREAGYAREALALHQLGRRPLERAGI